MHKYFNFLWLISLAVINSATNITTINSSFIQDYSKMSSDELKGALYQAVDQNNKDIANEILTHFKANNFNDLHKNPYGAYYFTLRDTFMLAADKGYINIIKELLRIPGIDVNYVDSDGHTVLMKAVQHKNTDLVKTLLQVPGINVNYGCFYYEPASSDFYIKEERITVLMLAADKGYADIVKELLKDPKIDVNKSSSIRKKTALMCAIMHMNLLRTKADLDDCLSIIKMLLKTPEIDVNCVDSNGITPIIEAANFFIDCQYSIILLRDLLKAGANINHCSTNNTTALSESLNLCRIDAVRELLKDPNINIDDDSIMQAKRCGGEIHELIQSFINKHRL